jgi:hypothetical protein
MKNSTNLKRSIALQESWKNRENYTDGLYGTQFHNTWRSMKYTLKGRKIGCEWESFNDFKSDMFDSYQDGLKICRLDKKLPFSKDNCVWVDSSYTGNIERLTKLEYLGEVKTLKEWCLTYELSYNGVRQRYFKGKNYTPKEVLFGKTKKANRGLLNQSELINSKLRAKASKMLAQYRLKDRKMNRTECDLTIEEFIEDFLKNQCVYCGTKDFIGADRVNNNLSHVRENLVPCCYRCNTVRQNHFTYEEMLKIGAFIRDNIEINIEIRNG